MNGTSSSMGTLALAFVVLAAGTADADVLCRGRDAAAAVIRARSVCRPSEVAVDPSSVGLASSTLANRVAALEAEVAKLRELLAALSLEDGGATLRLSGVNLQIVSGSGATDGVVNGRGNLIVGYNERSLVDFRQGSHNLIVGSEHTYTSYGGLVAGRDNALFAPHAAVTGGRFNTASGAYAAVTGGTANAAFGEGASVSGENGNGAHGSLSSVSGGGTNSAIGERSSVSGGSGNAAEGDISSVAGGRFNAAAGRLSSVGGGSGREAPAEFNWVAGALLEPD